MTTAVGTAGYSGTPLPRKLGLVRGMRLHVFGCPVPYGEIVAPLPEGIAFDEEPGPTTDLAHVFVVDKAVLADRLSTLRSSLRPTVPVWVSWPKRAARVLTDVTEDAIRAIALPMGFVDVKVCAVDATWSGLKLVVRVANR